MDAATSNVYYFNMGLMDVVDVLCHSLKPPLSTNIYCCLNTHKHMTSLTVKSLFNKEQLFYVAFYDNHEHFYTQHQTDKICLSLPFIDLS